MKYHQDMTRRAFRIFKTTKADEGEYTCQIDDERGIKMNGSLYVEKGDENDKIELECSVQNEDVEYDWYFEGEKILSELYPDRYEIILYEKVRKLVIKKLSPTEDKGRYKCKTGAMTIHCDVSIKPAVRIEKRSKDIDALEEEDLTLEVTLPKPDPRGKWI
ncbi:unnamed protein product [Adineta steineri]|uniref:Ig-like domain-containing protein n=1 Tax=Adineta steineri TaxID=433720 RepID=A0A819NMD0_9BILA|nr:unnamed protein product [Adineta steineri]CAF3998759.1 unnamed protein product [Adineta steineri]